MPENHVCFLCDWQYDADKSGALDKKEALLFFYDLALELVTPAQVEGQPFSETEVSDFAWLVRKSFNPCAPVYIYI